VTGVIGVDHADLAQSVGFVAGGEAGDDPAVASRRLQSFLALEIPTSGRSAEDQS
jgi:hypothetical protein